MRKIFLIFTLYICNLGFTQISTDPPQITRPLPSQASLMNFAEIPVNTHTGVPNISIPIYSFATYSKEITLGVSLNYHPAGISYLDKASDVGVGWSLSAGGAVSRTVINEPDEFYNINPAGPNYIEKPFDDVYSYSCLGASGRFKIIRNLTNNTFSIQKLDNSTALIEFDMNPTTLKVNSFTIYDSKGFKYIFDQTDVATSRFWVNRVWVNVPNEHSVSYVSTHHLTRVYDNNGKQLINNTFTLFSRPSPINPSLTDTALKLTEANSIGHGKIQFNYYYSNLLNNSYSDPVQLDDIVIMNYSGTVLKKYLLNYTFLTIKESRRFLSKVTELDRDLSNGKEHNFTYKTDYTNPYTCSEDYEFGTDLYGYLNLVPKYMTNEGTSYFYTPLQDLTLPDVCELGVLKSVTFPTGGKVEYEFESNTEEGSTDPAYYELIGTHLAHELNPDNFTPTTYASTNLSTSTSTTWQFTVTGTTQKKLFFKFIDTEYTSPLSDPPNQPLHPTYIITGANLNHNFQSENLNYNYACLGKSLTLNPGTYTIQINKLQGTSTSVTINITEMALNTSLKGWVYKAGLRIKKISHFESDTATTPAKSINYDYQQFSDTNLSSGVLYDGYWTQQSTDKMINPQMSYRNVKVFNTSNNGYTKFYYRSYTEQPYDTVNQYQPHYLAYKDGLLSKTEVFDIDNKQISGSENTYSFEESGDIFNPFPSVYGSATLNTKFSWAKLSSTISKSYFYLNNSTTPNIVETTNTYLYNSLNKQVSESTATNSELEILKTKYYYHTGNSTLSKNRISEIEKIEIYRGTELLSTSQINYGNSWYNNVSYLPNIITTSKGSQTLENRIRFNAYDDFSNPTEIQQEGGSVVTYLWGYNKTQPIAKIENATNAQVATALGVINVNLITEANLSTIDALRNNTSLANAFITTFTYLPEIGINTMTDPKNDKLTYEYDRFNRLKAVRDRDNKILSENQYYYRANNNEHNYVLSTTYKVETTSSVTSPSITQAVVNKTFFDGLGRTIQQVAHQQSNTGKDIVTPFDYDELGRQTKEFLPYVNSNASLNYNSNALVDQANYVDYTGQVAYSEKRFEKSPLNRVLEQAAPGNDWSLNNSDKHTIRFDYQTNDTSDEVRYFKTTSSGTNYATTGLYSISSPVDNGFYPINQLYKSITKNENWKSTDGNNNTSVEFKDKEGRVILKRNYGVSVVNNVEVNTKHDTYYVYDQYNNLTYVIPPLADGTITQAILDELCYQYKYDKRNRIVEKKLPAKQWEYIVYDKLDRIIAAGPTLSPFPNDPVNTYGWTITKYDALGRNILSAWTTGTNSSAYRKTLQDNYNNTSNPLFENRSASGTTMINVSFKYTNQSLPTTNYHVLSVNYFDDYNYTGGPTDFANVMNDNSQAVYYNTTTLKPKGLATGSWIRIVEASTVNPVRADISYILYDNKARPVRHRTNNYLTGYTQVDSKIDFAGKVSYTETKHKRISTDTELYTREDFTYTNQDRLVAHIHKIGLTGTQQPQLLSKKEYNELGQVMSKRVGGTDVTTYVGLQKVDYSYNIRGWLTGINKVDDTTNPLQQGNDPLDLFGFKINYNTIENETDYDGKALYNGNISETYWRTSSDNTLRKYGYQYDDLNRLKNAIYQKPEQSIVVTDSYNESMTYDKNGNIKSLQRYGDFDDPITAKHIDNLSYFYAENSNLLMKVTDATNSTIGFKDDSNGSNDTANDYSYDSNGNLLIDQNKGIVSIRYNHLNLPTEIVFTGTNKKINYLYNSAGQKVEKKVTNGSIITITDYLGGYQYTKSASNPVVLQFFPHAEGYVSNTGGVFNYVFNYTDHLGNNRVSYTLDPATQSLVILEENHYYPYGLKHSKYNIDQAYYDSGGSNVIKVPRLPYQYKYNGKEFQDELGLNMYDMDMRDYDPAIGRWVVQDPVVHHNFSSYNAFDNNPVFWADPSGADSQRIRDFNGKWHTLRSEDFDTVYQRTNGPGAEFTSLEAAAIDFGKQYNGLSIAYGIEIGTIFYSSVNDKGVKFYSYTRPVSGGGGLVKVDPTILKPNQYAEADGHTHGGELALQYNRENGKYWSETNRFSGGDDGDIGRYENRSRDENGKINNGYGRKIKGVLITPNGGVLIYDPYFHDEKGKKFNTGKKDGFNRPIYSYDVPINEDMPSDKDSGKLRLNENTHTFIPAILPLDFNINQPKRDGY